MARFCSFHVIVFLSSVFITSSLPLNGDKEWNLEQEQDPNYWRKWAKATLHEAASRKLNTNIAKNIILFMGDGNSLTTMFATRVLKGQRRGRPGEEATLSYERFPNLGLAKTYDVSHQISDSASTATAFLCGVKTNYATIGLSARASRGNCTDIVEHHLDDCMAEVAQKAGKSTGFVTTARVTHSSPAPLYAHTPERNWEDDSKISTEDFQKGCRDIGSQLTNSIAMNFNVIMGGGRQRLMPTNETDPEYPDKNGTRKDGRNIIDEWLEDKTTKGKKASYVWKKDEFDQIDPSKQDHILGVFEPSHMQYVNDSDEAGEPSLAQMVNKAIHVMKKNQKGYVLFVEGARIDHAHHDNWAKRALEEGLAFDEAVEMAVKLTNEEDTLIIVTADHSHGMITASYPYRGNDILGLTDYSDDRVLTGLSDTDHMPYTTILYSAGPGYTNNTKLPNGRRRNLTDVDIHHPKFEQQANIPLKYVPHDGTDVTIHARGPMAHLFHSTHEQNYIYNVMLYAACLGDSERQCTPQVFPTTSGSNPLGQNESTKLFALISFALSVLVIVS